MRRTSVLVTVLLLSAACFTYRAEPAPLPGPSHVRVRFDPSRPVAVAVAGRDTMRLSSVTEVEGRVLAARGDTLTLSVRGARDAGVRVGGLPAGGATAVVRLGAGSVTEVRRRDNTRTGLAIAAGGAVALLALLIAALSAMPPAY